MTTVAYEVVPICEVPVGHSVGYGGKVWVLTKQDKIKDCIQLQRREGQVAHIVLLSWVDFCVPCFGLLP